MSKNVIKLSLLFSFLLVIILLLNPKEGSLALVDVTSKNDIILKKDVDLISNSKSEKDIKNNTRVLQNAMDKVSSTGGGTVYLPSGTYYFNQGGTSSKKEKFVIKCKDNVKLKGSGIKGSNATILKPLYSNNNSSVTGGLDMFYFNNYSESNFKMTDKDRFNITYTDYNGKLQTLTNQKIYLDNADFEDFIIDGIDAYNKYGYDTTGKGFMINLFRDCDWNNVVVMNTDATGFGMDCPINSTVSNSVAINCGKAATESSGGASGFGIGTGYSNNEYLIIKNSYSFNNKKFGFFFEHQGRFTNSNHYPATTSKGFVVSNSVAGGNYADFGGLKAYDVTYEGSIGVTGSGNYSIPLTGNTVSVKKRGPGISFDYYSVNSRVVNMNIRNNFTDSSKTEVLWALNNSITNGSSINSFSPQSDLTRIEAVTLLYRLSSMPNGIFETCSYNDGTNCSLTNQISSYKSVINNIGFTDLTGSNKYSYNLDAVYWAYKAGVVSKDNAFNPTNLCTRSQFITMLYRLAGSPSVQINNTFSDVPSNSWYSKAVSWAVNSGITNGTSSTTFSPNNSVTREQAIVFLYRFNNRKNVSYDINYNLMGGSVKTNPSSYISGNSFKLNNPTKSGYIFKGWTGSNSTNPSTSVSVSKSSTGNLVYTANYEKNKYTISYNLDGGKFVNSPRTSYYIDSTDYELLVPYKDGYTFVGWTGSNGTKPMLSVKIYRGKTGNLTYTANYNKINNDTNPSKPTNPVEPVKPTNPTEPVKPTEPTKPDNPIENENKTLKSISIQTMPNKLTYFEGEKINTKGMILKLIYTDNSTETTDCCFSLSSTTANTEGKQSIKVTYKNKTTYYDINVKKILVNNITIKSLPYTITYYVGDKFSSKGLAINLIKNNNYIDSLTDGYDLSIKDGTILNKEGKITITVKYQNYKTSFDINVISKSKNNLILKSRPIKTNYLVGEELNLDGLELEYIINGKINKVSQYKISLMNGTILNSEGIKTIKITYEDKIVSFDILVKEVKNIEVKEDSLKLKYEVGDEFILDNLILNVSYTDGSFEEVSSGYFSSIKNGTILNKNNNRVIFRYGGKDTTVNIEVGSSEVKKEKEINYFMILIPLAIIIILAIIFSFKQKKNYY